VSTIPQEIYSDSLLHVSVQQGQFLIRGLPAGTYRVHKDSPQGSFVEVTLTSGESKTLTVD